MTTATLLKPRPKEQPMDNGIDDQPRVELARAMSRALADSYMLSLKTQYCHWNVVGPLFYSLHQLTEVQYRDLFGAIDNLAERIRALGAVAPGSLQAFSKLSDIQEFIDRPSAEDMVRELANDHETCARRMRLVVDAADAAGDVKTADMLTGRIGQHEENVWMLRAILTQ